MARENENDDFEERAAIREFDGCQPRGTAEFFAREEVLARTAQQGCLVRHPRRIQNPVCKIRQSFPAKSDSLKLQELMARRDELSSRMRAETNEQRKDELRTEWFDLCRQIIELRKGA